MKMPPAEQCERLISLVEEGNGIDRELDLMIERAFGSSSIHDDMLDKQPHMARAFTSSLDDAYRFLKECHPGGYTLVLTDAAFGTSSAKLSDVVETATGVSKTIPRALVSASIGLTLKHAQKA